jgi:hypothetical protein
MNPTPVNPGPVNAPDTQVQGPRIVARPDIQIQGPHIAGDTSQAAGVR